MKLYYSANSPFVRKVVIVAEALGLTSRIERTPATANPLVRDAHLRSLNPMGQLPTLVTDDGMALFDSPVICEYLDRLGDDGIIGNGSDRWRNLRDAALGDGLLEAALTYRYEKGMRPEALQWADWSAAMAGKVVDILDFLETHAGKLSGRLDIGPISFCCALVYLDWRLEELNWRNGRPVLDAWFKAFCERPEVAKAL